jgi:hypothetical protein
LRSEAFEQEVSCAGEDLFPYFAVREQAGHLYGAEHGGEDDVEGALAVCGAAAGHPGQERIAVVLHCAGNLFPDFRICAGQLGGKGCDGAAGLGVVDVVVAQILLDQRLPCGSGRSLAGGFNEAGGPVAEGFDEGLGEKVFPACEMFVKASVGEACVAHEAGYTGGGDSFCSETLGCIADDGIVRVLFVFWVVAHDYRMTWVIRGGKGSKSGAKDQKDSSQ